MTLEQIIRYTVSGILAQGGAAETMDDEIQELLDILRDFGNITNERLTDILNKC